MLSALKTGPGARWRRLFCAGVCALLASGAGASESDSDRIRTRVVPVVFATENIGPAIGVGGVSLGLGQPQAALFAVGFASKNNSQGFSVGAVNYQIPKLPALYFTGFLYDGDLPDYGYFASTDPGYSLRANDSRRIEERLGLKNTTARMQGRWVLPIGAGAAPGFTLSTRPALPRQRQTPVGWNPLTSGVTSVRFEWEEQTQDYRTQAGTSQTGASVYRGQLDWDNTGSRHIPREGGRISLTSSWGTNRFGRGDWRLNELELSGYLPLTGEQNRTTQQVIALNLYAADTPSWAPDGSINRPPEYLGARLGGLNRLRGYSSARFVDRSAWLYRAEYRFIPKWQPLSGLFGKLGYRVPWWQFTVFSDIGRVAPSFDLAEFHKDMKVSGGIGLRIFVEGLLVRVDFGVSEEESSTVFMIDQAF